MLRVDRNGKKFVRLSKPAMSEVQLTERYDLQHMIRNSPDAFFQEMGETLLLIGEEVRPTDFVEDRIDLLAVDQQGSLVVIELKRGSNKLQLLQALSYASMISKWEQGDILAQRQQLGEQSEEDTEEEIEQFLLQDASSLNDSQRVILVAEDFDYEVLITAEWLSETYDVDIRCFRLAISADNDTDFLACTCIYPPPEITMHAVKRGRKGRKSLSKWSNWDDALKAVANDAIVDFYRSELDKGRENHLSKRVLYYRFDGRRRFFLAARRKAVYVWQYRRFKDDETYWKETLGDHIDLKPIKEGNALRFFLSRPQDFKQFLEAVKGDLEKVEFLNEPLYVGSEETQEG